MKNDQKTQLPNGNGLIADLPSNDYRRVESVIRYLDAHCGDQPDLTTLAAQVGLSRFHFHRLFSNWAGTTPKSFLKCLTVSHAKSLLRAGHGVLETSFQAGLSGPGRLHDLCVSLEAASPGEIKSGGQGWTLHAGIAASPFGPCLIAQSPRGICHLSFWDGEISTEAATNTVLQDWPNAKVRWDSSQASSCIERIFTRHSAAQQSTKLKALVRGTEFQVRVWRALLAIPSGSLVSYCQLADAIHEPKAARAVGSAVSQNRLAVLIPCHRVIRQTGVIGEYRWGTYRKKALIAWETCSNEPEFT